MGQAQQRLTKGRYAYSSHSLRITGDITEVFVGRWEPGEGGTRRLIKYPSHAQIEGGALMCTVRLRRPIPTDEFKNFSHKAIRPLIKEGRSTIEVVLMDSEIVCTHPDGM